MLETLLAVSFLCNVALLLLAGALGFRVAKLGIENQQLKYGDMIFPAPIREATARLDAYEDQYIRKFVNILRRNDIEDADIVIMMEAVLRVFWMERNE